MFSSTTKVDQDCLPCQQSNLFFADMAPKTQSQLQFSASVNGKKTPVLPVMKQYSLQNTAPETVRELRYSLKGESQVVIEDLSQFQFGQPEQLKFGMAVETEPVESLPSAPFYPRSSLAAARFAKWIFLNEGEIGKLRANNPDEWVAMDQAYNMMGFQPELGKMPLRDASHMIRYLGEIDRRLATALDRLKLSARSKEILTERTERYRTIVQEEIRLRDLEKGEGVFVIALANGCPAAGMSDGDYVLSQTTPDQQVSLAACISMAFQVAWADYLEQVRSSENIQSAVDASVSSAVQGGAASTVTASALSGKLLVDLNQSFLNTRSLRTSRRMLAAPPPTLKEWGVMLRVFLREIMSNEFAIKTSSNGTKAVVFSGKATLRAHLTRAHYPADQMQVADSLARGSAPSWRGAAANALRGGVNRLFIAFAGFLEIKTWLESEREDWVDLIVRLGLVIVTTILTAIIAVFAAKLILGAAAVGIVLKLVVAGVSFLIGMVVAFVFELARIRQGLSGLIRFAGRALVTALTTVWGWIRSAWMAATSGSAAGMHP